MSESASQHTSQRPGGRSRARASTFALPGPFRGAAAFLMPIAVALLLAACASTPAETASPPPNLSAAAGDHRPRDQAAASSAAPAEPLPDHTLDAIRSGTLRIAVEPIGPVPNSGLLLPAVSPDGRWIAALKVADAAEVYPEDLFTGRALEHVQLVIMPVADPTDQTVIVARGAAWPAWSADSQRLVAVAYAADGGARLALHDRHTAHTRMLAPGFRRIIAPRFSPDGRHVAFTALGPDATGARLYLLDIRRRATTAAPDPPTDGDLFFAQWRDGRTLIVFRVDDHDAAVLQWPVGEAAMQPRATLRIEPPSADALFQCLVSIAEPLSPDGRRLTWFDPQRRRLVTLDLDTGERQPLAADSFAAGWLSPRLIVIATANDLLLAFAADRSPPRQLTHGRTLPRWADARAGRILFVSPSASPWSFELLRLHFSVGP